MDFCSHSSQQTSGVFFKNVDKDFGKEVGNNLRKLMKLERLLSNHMERRIFLLKCKNEKVFPDFIKKKVKLHLTFYSNRAKHKFDMKVHMLKVDMLKLCVTDVNQALREIKKELVVLHNVLEKSLPCAVRKDFIDQLNMSILKEKQKLRVNLEAKFDRLLEEKLLSCLLGNGKSDKKDNKKRNKFVDICKELGISSTIKMDKSDYDKLRSNWFRNLTNVEFPSEVLKILSLGENFAVPEDFKHFRVQNFIAEIERVLSTIENDEVDNVRKNIVGELGRHLKFLKANGNNRKLRIVDNFLKSNPDVLITRADKGQVTVALMKEDYIKAGNIMLADGTTYLEASSDNCVTTELVGNNYVTSLRKKGMIDDVQRDLLLKKNSVIPRLYLLPKIHKPQLAFRPIVSSVNGPLHKLARFLHNQLLPLSSEHFASVANSAQLVEEMKDMSIPTQCKLVSLDVTSLYTNVPIDLVFSAIFKKKSKLKSLLSAEELCRGVSLIMNNTYFTFNNKIYKQIFGLPMGSPLAPICAELVMQILEENCLNALSFGVPFYKRYVDDVLTCIPADGSEEIMNTFNNYHSRLKFTIEEEENSKISFLDVSLVRYRNSLEFDGISFDLYRKPTWSGRMLNFNSYHPMHIKLAVIKNSTDRILKIVDEENKANAFEFLIKTLMINDYPLDKILLTIRNRILFHKDKQVTTQVDTDDKDTDKVMVLPYSEHLTKRFTRNFRKLGVKVVSKIDYKIKKVLGTTKDIIPKTKRSNVVYKIGCNDCNKSYIGQTTRYFEKRLQEHVRSEKNPMSYHTALADHVRLEGHTFNFVDSRILDTMKVKFKRDILESYHIKKNNTVNYMVDTAKLPTIYERIMDI